MLDQIRIVLIHTSHPGNIGSAARAMKTMGIKELVLVAPVFFPSDKALELASGAGDLVAEAKVVESLDAAINDCHLIIGTSARSRAIPWPLETPREVAVRVKEATRKQQKVAILFGREQTGLTNEELERCHVHMQIPANPEYSSLNLAAAVQVVSYEMRIAALAEEPLIMQRDVPLATSEQVEGFFKQLELVLMNLDFLKLSAPRKLMTRLRRLFFRARLDVMEVNILRGILTAIEGLRRQGE